MRASAKDAISSSVDLALGSRTSSPIQEEEDEGSPAKLRSGAMCNSTRCTMISDSSVILCLSGMAVDAVDQAAQKIAVNFRLKLAEMRERRSSRSQSNESVLQRSGSSFSSSMPDQHFFLHQMDEESDEEPQGSSGLCQMAMYTALRGNGGSTLLGECTPVGS